MTQAPRLVSAACLLVLLSGCDALEPYERPYTWHPIGANQSNLANMVVDPRDLAQGRTMGPADGATAAAAVERLRHDRVKSLSDGTTNSGSLSSPAASPATN